MSSTAFRGVAVGVLLCSALFAPMAPAAPAGDRSRLLILADMGNEPDEVQQMVHMIVCSNEFELEGLVAVSGIFLRPESASPYKRRLHPELFHQIIDAYEKVLPNLKQHATGWHEPDDLRSLVAAGQPGYGIAATGPSQSTPGSRLIIKAVERDDPRPLWVVVNAGSNTLAQALIDYRAQHAPAEVDAFVARLRVFENGAQDDAGAWICAEFPDIHWLRSNYQTYAYGGPGGGRRGDAAAEHFPLGPHVWKPYAYSTIGQHQWALEHIVAHHGELGAVWPLRLFPSGGLAFLEGGGTVPWLGLVNKGLFSTEHPHWGGWSGRFSRQKQLHYYSRHRSVRSTEEKGRLFRMYVEAADHWINPEDGQDMSGLFAPVWRFRRASYNDFLCRMDWCVQPYEKANHHPLAAFGGDATNSIVRLGAAPGETIELDASASSDPDGDALDFRWWLYKEAGTYEGELDIPEARAAQTACQVPVDASGKEIHVILEVQDRSPVAPLWDYRRIVIRVQ